MGHCTGSISDSDVKLQPRPESTTKNTKNCFEWPLAIFFCFGLRSSLLFVLLVLFVVNSPLSPGFWGIIARWSAFSFSSPRKPYILRSVGLRKPFTKSTFMATVFDQTAHERWQKELHA